MKKSWLITLLFCLILPSVLNAEESFPKKLPAHLEWSFSGPFGQYDKAQLRRGLRVYREVCAACHSLNYVAFRDLSALGFDNDEIRDIAKQYSLEDGPNSQGEMFIREGEPSDYFPPPFANDTLAAIANNGAIPGDLSLMARARAVREPFGGFIKDVFTNYISAGPDYIYALLMGYQDPPEGYKLPDGSYYNPYYISADTIAMPQSLFDDSVIYEDGSPQTRAQYAKDVAAFLMWSADPHMKERKITGFYVICFLLVLAILVYSIKRLIFRV